MVCAFGIISNFVQKNYLTCVGLCFSKRHKFHLLKSIRNAPPW